jgi:hypothetical protein
VGQEWKREVIDFVFKEDYAQMLLFSNNCFTNVNIEVNMFYRVTVVSYGDTLVELIDKRLPTLFLKVCRYVELLSSVHG